jgi:hypothetical protein
MWNNVLIGFVYRKYGTMSYQNVKTTATNKSFLLYQFDWKLFLSSKSRH